MRGVFRIAVLLLVLPGAASAGTLPLRAWGSSGRVTVGKQLRVTVQLRNSAQATAAGRVCPFSDQLGSGVWLRRTYPRGKGCQRFRGLRPGASRRFRFVYRAQSPRGSSDPGRTVRLTYRSYYGTSSVESNNTDLDVLVRQRAAKVSLQVQLRPRRVLVGSTQRLRVRVRNRGKVVWRGELCDIYSSDGDPRLILTSWSGACRPMTLRPGRSRSITWAFQALGTRDGSVLHRIRASADGQLLASRQLRTWVHRPRPRLQLRAALQGKLSPGGDPVQLQVQVSNRGDGATGGLWVCLQVPGGVSVQSGGTAVDLLGRCQRIAGVLRAGKTVTVGFGLRAAWALQADLQITLYGGREAPDSTLWRGARQVRVQTAAVLGGLRQVGPARVSGSTRRWVIRLGNTGAEALQVDLCVLPQAARLLGLSGNEQHSYGRETCTLLQAPPRGYSRKVRVVARSRGSGAQLRVNVVSLPARSPLGAPLRLRWG